MAAENKINLPEGFVLDGPSTEIKLPEGFVLDSVSSGGPVNNQRADFSDADLIARMGRPYTPGEQSPYERVGVAFDEFSKRQPEPAIQKRQQEWTNRVSAFSELQNRGYAPDQINMAAQIYADTRKPDADRKSVV